MLSVCVCLCIQVMTGNSILSELTKAELSKKVGHFGFRVNYKEADGRRALEWVVCLSLPVYSRRMWPLLPIRFVKRRLCGSCHM